MEQRDDDGNGNDFAEHAHVNLPPVRILRRHHVEMALTAAAARAAPAGTREGGELRRVHAVTATTITALVLPAGGDGVTRSVTAWIHSATIGIEPGCFREIPHVSRVLVRPHTDPSDAVAATHMHSAAVLGALIRKLGSYERDLVEMIRGFVMHDFDEVHRVGISAFWDCAALEEVGRRFCSLTHVLARCTVFTAVPHARLGSLTIFTICTCLKEQINAQTHREGDHSLTRSLTESEYALMASHFSEYWY